MKKTATNDARKTASKKKAVRKKVVAKKVPAKKAAKKTAASKPRRAARGRPSSYSDALADAICGWLKQGYTLRQIEALPNMPAKSTIIRWLGEHDYFQDQYARAREVHAMVMEDELLELAENSSNDWLAREGKGGAVELEVNRELLERTRLRIDTRKWLMGKMAPKRYGKSLALTGKDGGPVKHEVATVGDVLDAIDGAGTGLPGDAGDK